MNDRSIYEVVAKEGFFPSFHRENVFLLDRNADVTPGFFATVVRRRGSVRLSGGIGLFFKDFEHYWERSVSLGSSGISSTLPLIMAIDNFPNLLDSEVFEFTNDMDRIRNSAKSIFDLCTTAPKSIKEFEESLLDKKLLGKNFSDFLHIFSYHDTSNVFYRKSVKFSQWVVSEWPDLAQEYYACLTNFQLERLKTELS